MKRCSSGSAVRDGMIDVGNAALPGRHLGNAEIHDSDKHAGGETLILDQCRIRRNDRLGMGIFVKFILTTT